MQTSQEHAPVHGSQQEPSRVEGQPLPVPASMLTYPPELIEGIQRIMQQHAGSGQDGAVLLVSIDNFAMILSGYGHDVSETMMQALITQVGALLSPKDHIARLQRDQLAVVLASSFPEETSQLAVRIMNVIQSYGRERFTAASLHVISTVGAVHFPSETTEARDALDKAFIALRSRQEGAYRTYASTRQEADLSRQHMGLASYLYGAFKENRLRLAWQPVIETASGRVVHYEALLRMIGHGGKITSAGALIPVAEKMGLIDSIDRMVLEMVVKELRECPDVRLALNISNLTTDSQTWLEYLQALLEQTPAIAPRLIIEITETAAQRDLRRVAYFVAAVQSFGCMVALDDFGSGYTSFRQLKALSVDMIKIDGVFIKDLPHNADNRFFVRTLLDFIRGFGLISVAEFVETGEIAKILMELGVDYMQGYYFGKPENRRRWLQHGEYQKD